jgi:hypothetical protein
VESKIGTGIDWWRVPLKWMEIAKFSFEDAWYDWEIPAVIMS